MLNKFLSKFRGSSKPPTAKEAEEQRVLLSNQVQDGYDVLTNLTTSEQDLFAQGKTATSKAVKRRLSSQIADLRRQIGRQHSFIKLRSGQLNILSTNLHNKEIIANTQSAVLPSSEELVDNATRAEELIESVSDNFMTSETIDHRSFDLSSDEEDSIMLEFETLEKEKKEKKEKKEEKEEKEEEPTQEEKIPYYPSCDPL